jgi:NAD(P)-dependent dehydrogenase (short-subunit alcohol dehydrogenase family)
MSVIDSFRLDGKAALVSGGAGLYGKQIVEALAEAGAKVIVASRGREALDKCVDGWRRNGLDVAAETLDQSSTDSIEALAGRIAERVGGVHVLVNNAVARPVKDWSSLAEAFESSMRVNATGGFLMTRAFADQMTAKGGGSIINIGSIQGMVGPDFTLYEGLGMSAPPDYFFHKAGMLNFTRYAAALLGPCGVRVNTISPGGLNDGELDPRFIERYSARTFLGRMCNESDLKGAVVFLASDASAYITGANIPVDGGYTAK